eukprot:9723731-Heterocapsa_arctica.AAC.1
MAATPVRPKAQAQQRFGGGMGGTADQPDQQDHEQPPRAIRGKSLHAPAEKAGVPFRTGTEMSEKSSLEKGGVAEARPPQLPTGIRAQLGPRCSEI